MEMLAQPLNGISDGEIAVYAADMSKAVAITAITLDGQQVAVRDDAEFVIRDGANAHTCTYW